MGVVRNEKERDERIDEGVLRWFDHVERMGNERIAKRIYVGECGDSHPVGRRGRGGLIP